MDNEKFRMILRKIATRWIEEHPAIKTFYFVHSSKPKDSYLHFENIVVAIVPKPDNNYREWAGDGTSCVHVKEDMARLGVKDYLYLTFRNLKSAEGYYDEIIRPELHPETEIQWDDLTEKPEDKKEEPAAYSMNKRSRSTDDRKIAIDLAKQYIDEYQTKKKRLSCHDAAIIIKRKFKKDWQLRTIQGWIKSYFPDEAKKPGRPKKKKNN